MWYAAKTLTIPTASVHVPNVLDERGVTGEDWEFEFLTFGPEAEPE